MGLISSEAERVDCRHKTESVLTENARKVLETRYLKKDQAGGCIERPADLFHRVAKTMADIEISYGGDAAERQRWENRFYELMTSGRFIPNSPTLMNAGREMGMLSACFVLPVRDSVVDIFNSIKHTALIQKAGGGTGFAFDELRPTGDFIQSSGGTTSGPISFWRAFSEATNAIQQGAFRRGANMGMMYIHHPDILKFLHAKQDLDQFNNYNISVKVTDTWMEEFRADPDSPHVVRNPRDGKAGAIPRNVDIWKYDTRDLVELHCVEPISPNSPRTYYTTPRLIGPLPEDLHGRIYTKRDIWNIIISNSWQTGEPGVVFIDRINEHNPTPQVGRIEATNPCGEQPLLPYEACNLGSVNLGYFVRNACTPQAEVDWEALRETVYDAVRFLDNVIDANNYPLKEIDQICKANRKIGLGIMGFADALFKLGVAYNSEEGIAWGKRFMEFINNEGHACSEQLAQKRGCFPNWEGSIWQSKHGRRMRNAAVTTVAPTGTISIIANCSGGVEPMFSLAFIRNVLREQKQSDKRLVEVNDTFRHVAQQRGFLTDDLLRRLSVEGTLANLDDIPEDVRRVFVCAHDITPQWHMRMQAAFQCHCDSSISKTINFPHEATREDVEKIYHLAFELGCKGVTVYRNGCRSDQPMSLATDDRIAGTEFGLEAAETESVESDHLARETAIVADGAAEIAEVAPVGRPAAPARKFIEPTDLPEIVSGLRIRQMTPFGNMHVKITVDLRVDRELEVFAQLGKGADVATSDLEAICRMVSLWLRAGGSLRHVIKQLEGIGSSLQIPARSRQIGSLGDGLACALKKYTRAKERFGLRDLLLGEVDLSELENSNPPPHGKKTTPVDRTISATEPAEAPLPPKGPNGGGATQERREQSVGYTEQAVAASRLRGTDATRLSGTFEPEARAQAVLTAHGSNGGGLTTTIETATAVAEAEYTLPDLIETIGITSDRQVIRSADLVKTPTRLAASVSSKTAAPRRFPRNTTTNHLTACPQCGGAVARQEGCLHCSNHCGWAAC